MYHSETDNRKKSLVATWSKPEPYKSGVIILVKRSVYTYTLNMKALFGSIAKHTDETKICHMQSL